MATSPLNADAPATKEPAIARALCVWASFALRVVFALLLRPLGTWTLWRDRHYRRELASRCGLGPRASS